MNIPHFGTFNRVMMTSSNGSIFRITGHLWGECDWINGWVNNGEAGDLRRHRAHYDVTVMITMGRETPDRKIAFHARGTYQLISKWMLEFDKIFMKRTVLIHVITNGDISYIKRSHSRYWSSVQISWAGVFFNSWNHKLLDDLMDLKSKYVSLNWMHLKILVQIFIGRFIAGLAVVRERTDLYCCKEALCSCILNGVIELITLSPGHS